MNINHKHRKLDGRARRSATALMEFALVAPILLTLTMGLVQYSIIANATTTLANLTREGARYAAVNPSSDSAIKSHISDAAAVTPLKYSDLTITISPTSASSRTSGTSITVTIGYDMRKKFFMPNNFPGLSKFGSSYSSSCVMIIE